jgi:hypothetical protein
MVFVGALRSYAGIPLKILKLPMNFRFRGACRRAERKFSHDKEQWC